MEEKVIETLKKLSEGKLTPLQWKEWFIENTKNVEKICGRTNFLRLKPSKSFSDIENIYYAQKNAVKWLDFKGIECNFSGRYEKEWKKEFDEFCRKKDEEEKQLKRNIEKKFSYLKDIFPKLFKQLTKSFDEYTIIKNEINLKDINNKEKEFNISMSEDLKNFFVNISTFEFEAINIEFKDIELETFNKKEYLILGEFWKYGDGDKLLYNIENHSIYVYAHGENKVYKQSNNMKDFIENKVTYHLRQYIE